MKKQIFLYVVLYVVLTLLILPLLSAETKYGAADFYPTPENPIGWLADGFATYPGATPPVHWDEASGKNILWQVPMPMPSNSQPIIIGNKVITLADPDQIICVDLKSGKILWKVQVLEEIFPQIKHKENKNEIREAFVKAIDANFFIYQGGPYVNPKWREELWRPAAEKLPNNKFLVERVNMLTNKCPTIVKAYNEGEKNIREFTTDKILSDAGLPKGWETEDFNWFTCTFVSPVSDGKRIYARFLHDTIISTDLNGNICWVFRPEGQKRNGLGQSTHALMLYKDCLYVCTDNPKAIFVLDTDTGKVKRKFETNKEKTIHLNWGEGHVLTPLWRKGKLYYITTAFRGSKKHIIDTENLSIIGELKGGTGPIATGTFILDDIMYNGHNAYSWKDNTGVAAWRITDDEGENLKAEELWWSKYPYGLQDKRKTCKVTWRGICVSDKIVFACGDDTWVMQFDRKDGKHLASLQAERGRRCPHTNEPVIAGDKVYVPTWNGLTSVFDANSGELLSVNRTEPMCGNTLTFQGKYAVLRGWFHLYCFAEKL